MSPPRTQLPSRRLSETISFEHCGVPYEASISRFADGSIAELFLSAGKTGSAADTLSRDTAVLLSIARQYGVPLQLMYDALVKLGDGSPAGPVGVALQMFGDVDKSGR